MNPDPPERSEPNDRTVRATPALTGKVRVTKADGTVYEVPINGSVN